MAYVIPTVTEYAKMSNKARVELIKRLGIEYNAPTPKAERLMNETQRVANAWLQIYGVDPDAERHWRELAAVVYRG